MNLSDDFDKSDGDDYGLLAALNRAAHIDDELQAEKEEAANRLGHALAYRIGKLSSEHIQQAHVNGKSSCSFSLSVKFSEPEQHGQTNSYGAIAMYLDGSKVYEVEPDEGAWRDNIIFLHSKRGKGNITDFLESMLHRLPIAKFTGAGSELTLTLGELCIHTESMLNDSAENKVANRIKIVVKVLSTSRGRSGISPLEDILQTGHLVCDVAGLTRWPQPQNRPRAPPSAAPAPRSKRSPSLRWPAAKRGRAWSCPRARAC